VGRVEADFAGDFGGRANDRIRRSGKNLIDLELRL
jgi:hypothetical protein